MIIRIRISNHLGVDSFPLCSVTALCIFRHLAMPGIWSQTLEQQTEMDLLLATLDSLIVCLFHHLKGKISFTIKTCSVLNICMQSK